MSEQLALFAAHNPFAAPSPAAETPEPLGDDVPNAGEEKVCKADDAITELRFALLYFVALSDADIAVLDELPEARRKNLCEQMSEIGSLTTTRLADTLRRVNAALDLGGAR